MRWIPKIVLWAAAIYVNAGCQLAVPKNNDGIVDTLINSDTLLGKVTIATAPDLIDTTIQDNLRNKDTAFLPPSKDINVKNVNPESVIKFAETLKGVPYVYASTNPNVGFDCSGFITYVFNHFNISVPRSSVDFTNVGKTIPIEQAKRGDIILFTGTNPLERHVGHMGLIVSNGDSLRFIHSTSGKAMGVTVTVLGDYYKKRFVKALRIFPQNDK